MEYHLRRRRRTIFSIRSVGTLFMRRHSMQAQSIGHFLGKVPHPGEYSDHTDLASTQPLPIETRCCGIALLVLAACWGAWVFLIGFNRVLFRRSYG